MGFALMDTLPVELLSSIFSFACTDGGYTGASLSAISNRIRTLSRPYSFQSIALFSWTQIVAFSLFLHTCHAAQTPLYLRFHCHHLYMTDRRSAWPSRVCHGGDSLNCDRDSLSLSSPDVQDAPNAPGSHAEHAYHILTLLGPHLRTLTLLAFEEPDASSSISTSLRFPFLEELTIHGSFFRSLKHAGSRNLCTPPLRRLHIIQNVTFEYEFVKQVSELAPALTHLRLSELSTAMHHIGDLVHTGVASIIRVGGPGNDDEHRAFPRTLEKLVLQFRNEDWDVSSNQASDSVPLSAYRTAYLEAQFKYMLSTLWRYIKADSKRRVVVLRPYSHDEAKAHPQSGHAVPTAQQCCADVERSWKARAAGEDGLWDVKDSDILLAYDHRGPLGHERRAFS
ncbi:hypothetical protein C8T65DRAFT_65209 [Cerioporus squamosus]|nr:hypothetical protein C8T65DRAFT_65209 [Cerioporus squamosus]